MAIDPAEWARRQANAPKVNPLDLNKRISDRARIPGAYNANTGANAPKVPTSTVPAPARATSSTSTAPSFGINRDQISSMFQNYINSRSQPVRQFSYNPQKDDLYQDALKAAQRSAETETGNTMARLRAMGQGRSSYSEGVAQQIGQNAIADVNSRVLPQLASQAYKRYLDEQTMARTRDNDLLGLAGMLDERDYTERRDARLDQVADLEREDKLREARIKYAQDIEDRFGIPITVTEEYGLMDAQKQGTPTIKAQTEQRQYFQELVNASDKLGYVLPELAQLIGVQPFTNTLSSEKEITDAAYRMGMLDVSRSNAATNARQADISARNADLRERELDMREDEPREVNINSYIPNLRQLYVDSNGNITNPKALRNAIIGYNLPDDATDALLLTFGLPIN